VANDPVVDAKARYVTSVPAASVLPWPPPELLFFDSCGELRLHTEGRTAEVAMGDDGEDSALVKKVVVEVVGLRAGLALEGDLGVLVEGYRPTASCNWRGERIGTSDRMPLFLLPMPLLLAGPLGDVSPSPESALVSFLSEERRVQLLVRECPRAEEEALASVSSDFFWLRLVIVETLLMADPGFFLRSAFFLFSFLFLFSSLA